MDDKNQLHNLMHGYVMPGQGGAPGGMPPQGQQQFMQQGLYYGMPPGAGGASHHHNSHNERIQQLQQFWQEQMRATEQVTDFKSHSLPLARIKKIMKSDEDVRMISSEAPALFAKACEMFILELTLRSWNHAEDNKRRTLQKDDIAAALNSVEVFDFLVDVVPRDPAAAGAVGGDPKVAVGAGAGAGALPQGGMLPRGDLGPYGYGLPGGGAPPPS